MNSIFFSVKQTDDDEKKYIKQVHRMLNVSRQCIYQCLSFRTFRIFLDIVISSLLSIILCNIFGRWASAVARAHQHRRCSGPRECKVTRDGFFL